MGYAIATHSDGMADLAGCVPGWGCERVIEHQLTEYGLRDTVTHNQGAYNAIIADTIVEWLEVPYSSLPDGRTDNTEFDGKNLGFAVNSLRVFANNDFLEANPAAAKLFEAAALDINDVSAQNKKMRDGEDSIEDIERHVDEWISANQETFDSWVKMAQDAS